MESCRGDDGAESLYRQQSTSPALLWFGYSDHFLNLETQAPGHDHAAVKGLVVPIPGLVRFF